jgi:hypothetical protein
MDLVLVMSDATPSLLTRLSLPTVGTSSIPCQSLTVVENELVINLYCTYLLSSLLEINLHIIT